MIKDVIVAFLVVVSIFFTIMPHRVHCDTFKIITTTCPTHWVFMVSGILTFLLAILISQWSYIIDGVTELFR
jgi:hypothetical protein